MEPLSLPNTGSFLATVTKVVRGIDTSEEQIQKVYSDETLTQIWKMIRGDVTYSTFGNKNKVTTVVRNYTPLIRAIIQGQGDIKPDSSKLYTSDLDLEDEPFLQSFDAKMTLQVGQQFERLGWGNEQLVALTFERCHSLELPKDDSVFDIIENLLKYAFERGDINFIEKLLSHPQITELCKQEENKCRIMLKAEKVFSPMNRCEVRGRQFLEICLKILYKDCKDFSQLFQKAYKASKDYPHYESILAKYLLSLGAVTLVTDDDTALDVALTACKYKDVYQILQHCKDSNAPQLLPYQFVAYSFKGDLANVNKILVDPDFDPSFSNNAALYAAVSQVTYINREERIGIINKLLEDTRVACLGNFNPLFLACCQTGYVEIMEKLIEGRKLTEEFSYFDGGCAAIEHFQIEVFKFLLDKGKIDPTATNNYFFEKALRRGDYGIPFVICLLEHKKVRDSIQFKTKDSESIKESRDQAEKLSKILPLDQFRDLDEKMHRAFPHLKSERLIQDPQTPKEVSEFLKLFNKGFSWGSTKFYTQALDLLDSLAAPSESNKRMYSWLRTEVYRLIKNISKAYGDNIKKFTPEIVLRLYKNKIINPNPEDGVFFKLVYECLSSSHIEILLSNQPDHMIQEAMEFCIRDSEKPRMNPYGYPMNNDNRGERNAEKYRVFVRQRPHLVGDKEYPLLSAHPEFVKVLLEEGVFDNSTSEQLIKIGKIFYSKVNSSGNQADKYLDLHRALIKNKKILSAEFINMTFPLDSILNTSSTNYKIGKLLITNTSVPLSLIDYKIKHNLAFKATQGGDVQFLTYLLEDTSTNRANTRVECLTQASSSEIRKVILEKSHFYDRALVTATTVVRISTHIIKFVTAVVVLGCTFALAGKVVVRFAKP